MDSITDTDSAAPSSVAERWVDEHAGYLFRYVLPRVRDRDLGEELVQETFLAAVKAVDTFRAESSPRTWLVGILRRKIVDHFRKLSRNREAESLDVTDPTVDAMFDRNERWLKSPRHNQLDPAALRESADFWRVFEECLRALPDRTAEAFTLRVMDEMKPDEVCKILSISTTNLWVMLHRAGARLRACLEVNWFESEQGNQANAIV